MPDPIAINEQAAQLSPRQQEMLQLLGSGLSLSESAERLTVSRSTANSHRARLMDRLQLSNRDELIEFAQLWMMARVVDASSVATDQTLTEPQREVCVTAP